MNQPRVLLALAGDNDLFANAIKAAGFIPVSTSDNLIGDDLERIDLAVFDCDADAEILALRTAINADVPTILMLGDGEVPIGLAGAQDDIALKPLLPESLVYRLQALLIRAGREVPSSSHWSIQEVDLDAPLAGEGRVVSVFAPKGGVGKTTIAVNVAIALREQSKSQVLLFDADVGVGNIASVLDIPASMGLADLADSPSAEWYSGSFDRLISKHATSGLDVLAWGTEPSQSAHISLELMAAALQWAKSRYAYIVIDTHPGYDERTVAMLSIARDILLIVTPEVGSIRNSSQFLEMAREMGIRDAIKVVVNRANHGINLNDISASLGVPISATVESNGHKAVLASNEGQAIISKYPNERIALDLRKVAHLISKPEVAEAVKNHGWRSLIKARTSASR